MSKAKDPVVVDHIGRYGWHVALVSDRDDPSPFAYTIGLFESYGHPEVVISGLNANLQAMHTVLNNVGSVVARGGAYAAGTTRGDVLEGFLCWFLRVPDERYGEVVGQAIRHYGGRDFPLVQLVWPSSSGAYPWDGDLDPVNRRRQTLWAMPPAGAERRGTASDRRQAGGLERGPRDVLCAEHGRTEATFVCRHLVHGAGLGFLSAYVPENPRPDAWCGACEALRLQHDGRWPAEAERSLGVTLLCGGCYDGVRERNFTGDPALTQRYGIRVSIVGYAADPFPGWVEATLVDASGVAHTFHEKGPVIAGDVMDANTHLPHAGVVEGRLMARFTRDDGSKVVIVDTEEPWGIRSSAGVARFCVFEDKLVPRSG